MKKILIALLIACSAVIAQDKPADTAAPAEAEKKLTFQVAGDLGFFYADGAEVGKTKVDDEKKIYERIIDIPDGIYIEKYPNGKTKGEYSFKDKGYDGTWKIYRQDGSIEEESNYVNGRRSGVSKNFYPNGQVFEEVSYGRNKKNGPSKSYYSNGTIQKDFYCKDDGFHGEYKEFYFNGAPKMTANFKNGKEVGMRTEYEITGAVRAKWDYSSGKPVEVAVTEEAGKPKVLITEEGGVTKVLIIETPGATIEAGGGVRALEQGQVTQESKPLADFRDKILSDPTYLWIVIGIVILLVLLVGYVVVKNYLDEKKNRIL